MVACFLALVIGMAELAGYVSSFGDAPMSDQQKQVIAERLEFVGQVHTPESLAQMSDAQAATDESSQSASLSGKQLVEMHCLSCHTPAVAQALGAPAYGDKAEWDKRLQKGWNTLYESAIYGIGNMPARGGSSLSDEEIKKAVRYLAGK